MIQLLESYWSARCHDPQSVLALMDHAWEIKAPIMSHNSFKLLLQSVNTFLNLETLNS